HAACADDRRHADGAGVLLRDRADLRGRRAAGAAAPGTPLRHALTDGKETDMTKIVQTTAGQVRGSAEDGAIIFRGVPYAAAPGGARRFQPPQPAVAWSGVRDCVADSAIAPQNRSRLAHVMGDFEREQSEDCLTLSLYVPEGDVRKAPVIVWLHGGAYSS